MRCTNVLVLVSAENQTLWNSICGALSDAYTVIKATTERILVRKAVDPFNIQVIMAFAYTEDNVAQLRVALSCADNVIFFGSSSSPYLLTTLAFENNHISLFDPELDPKHWQQYSVCRKDLCYQSARVLGLIQKHK